MVWHWRKVHRGRDRVRQDKANMRETEWKQ